MQEQLGRAVGAQLCPRVLQAVDDPRRTGLDAAAVLLDIAAEGGEGCRREHVGAGLDKAASWAGSARRQSRAAGPRAPGTLRPSHARCARGSQLVVQPDVVGLTPQLLVHFLGAAWLADVRALGLRCRGREQQGVNGPPMSCLLPFPPTFCPSPFPRRPHHPCLPPGTAALGRPRRTPLRNQSFHGRRGTARQCPRRSTPCSGKVRQRWWVIRAGKGWAAVQAALGSPPCRACLHVGPQHSIPSLNQQARLKRVEPHPAFNPAPPTHPPQPVVELVIHRVPLHPHLQLLPAALAEPLAVYVLLKAGLHLAVVC